MDKNHCTYYVNSRFSKNKNCNDSLVTKFFFFKTKIKLTCHSQYCSTCMFPTKCRKYCLC